MCGNVGTASAASGSGLHHHQFEKTRGWSDDYRTRNGSGCRCGIRPGYFWEDHHVAVRLSWWPCQFVVQCLIPQVVSVAYMFSNFISSIRRFILETSVVVSPYFFVFLQLKFSSWSIALWRSCAALMVLLMTSAAHAKLEGNDIQLQASWWIFAWYGVFCFDQIYIKAVITKVKLPTWSNVYPSSKIRFRSHSVWFVSFGRDLAL